MFVATVLVIMMSIPGLALFYGGLVRSKNMLSVLMQVFVVFSLIVVLWAIYGYSVAFTENGAFFGGLTRLFLSGIFTVKDGVGSFATAATFSKGVVIPEYLFIVFQATFAAITVALIVGAFAERMKFSAVLLFAILWFTFAYLPIAHMVWFWPGPDGIKDAATLASESAKGGWLWQKGALDFAGGTVVHINAGVAGLVGAYVVGKRVGYGKDSMAPHNLTFTMIGASLLWVGWFGFNAGSALEAGDTAALAFINTLVATAAAVLSWMAAEWADKGQAVDAGCRVGSGRRTRRDHAGVRIRRRQRRPDHRIARRRRVPVGRERAQEDAGRRRRARRIRRARRRRYPWRIADGRVRGAEARRARHLRLRREQDRAPITRSSTSSSSRRRAWAPPSSGPVSWHFSPTSSSTWRLGCA